MKALWARAIKFSVEGFGRILGGGFDAPGVPVAHAGDGEDLGDLGSGIALAAKPAERREEPGAPGN